MVVRVAVIVPRMIVPGVIVPGVIMPAVIVPVVIRPVITVRVPTAILVAVTMADAAVVVPAAGTGHGDLTMAAHRCTPTVCPTRGSRGNAPNMKRIRGLRAPGTRESPSPAGATRFAGRAQRVALIE